MKFDYILGVTAKEIDDTIYDLGTEYIRMIISSESGAQVVDSLGNSKNISLNVARFLTDNEFIDTELALSSKGKNYYKGMFVLDEIDACYVIMKSCILSNPIVNLVSQVFYGRGRVGKKQLYNLLNFHSVTEGCQLQEQGLTTFLVLLNKYKVLTYDKRNGLFYINENDSIEAPIDAYFVEPTTPFSNVYNMRKAIRTCLGNIFWIDKHFRKEGFQILIDGLSSEGVSSVTIISGQDNLTQSARNDYAHLKEELSFRGIQFTWNIITDKSFKWHDRWLLSDNANYNIPPVLALLRGQRSEIIHTDTAIDINSFQMISHPVENV